MGHDLKVGQLGHVCLGGLGSTPVEHAEAYACSRGVGAVDLLTTTAATFLRSGDIAPNLGVRILGGSPDVPG